MYSAYNLIVFLLISSFFHDLNRSKPNTLIKDFTISAITQCIYIVCDNILLHIYTFISLYIQFIVLYFKNFVNNSFGKFLK